MKRALTLTLTVGLIAALALLGAAGTAAACADDTTAGAQDVGEEAGDSQEATSVVAQYQDADQTNVAVQQNATADASGGDASFSTGDNVTNSSVNATVTAGDGGNATATQNADQSNSNAQVGTSVAATLDEFDLNF